MKLVETAELLPIRKKNNCFKVSELMINPSMTIHLTTVVNKTSYRKRTHIYKAIDYVLTPFGPKCGQFKQFISIALTLLKLRGRLL